MEIETLNNKTLNIRNNRVPDITIFPYDLPRLIKNMKDTPAWKHGELAATILLKSPNKQIVLTILHDNTEVHSFQSGKSVTFQIIEGRIELHTPEKALILDKGQFLTLHDNTKFRLSSLGESVFLLSFLNGQ